MQEFIKRRQGGKAFEAEGLEPAVKDDGKALESGLEEGVVGVGELREKESKPGSQARKGNLLQGKERVTSS